MIENKYLLNKDDVITKLCDEVENTHFIQGLCSHDNSQEELRHEK